MKIRAIINGVSFYTTKTAIKRRRVGDLTMQNDGIGTTVRYYDNQMGQHKFDIQLSKVC